MVMTWRYFNTEGWFFALSAVSGAAGRTLHLIQSRGFYLAISAYLVT